jgi:transposase
MNPPVLDVYKLLESFKETIDGLNQQIGELSKQVVGLTAENTSLKARLAAHEPLKDSHNSSIPPSKESIKAQALRRTRSLREKSNRPNGGQVGHTGSTLKTILSPSKVVLHTPNFCTRCGNNLSSIEGTIINTRQSVDIPLPIQAIVTEHRLVQKKCTCGQCSQLDFPKDIRSSISYGTNIRALVAYLSNVQFIPYKRTVEVIKDCWGVNLSEGTIYNMLQDMNAKSDSAYKEIRRQVELASVVGADESGAKVNSELYWTWVWQTSEVTYAYCNKSRGKAAIDNQFPNGLPRVTLVTDRHSSYFNMDVKKHQICLAHILRELAYLDELDTQQTWSTQLAELIREAIHQRKSKAWESIDRDAVNERFRQLLETSTVNFHQKVAALQKSLNKHQNHVFRFLQDPNVPYDNNASERAVRPLKVKQKVSGGFRHNLGADAFCKLHSITQTAKKNGTNALLALIAVANNF